MPYYLCIEWWIRVCDLVDGSVFWAIRKSCQSWITEIWASMPMIQYILWLVFLQAPNVHAFMHTMIAPPCFHCMVRHNLTRLLNTRVLWLSFSLLQDNQKYFTEPFPVCIQFPFVSENVSSFKQIFVCYCCHTSTPILYLKKKGLRNSGIGKLFLYCSLVQDFFCRNTYFWNVFDLTLMTFPCLTDFWSMLITIINFHAAVLVCDYRSSCDRGISVNLARNWLSFIVSVYSLNFNSSKFYTLVNALNTETVLLRKNP